MERRGGGWECANKGRQIFGREWGDHKVENKCDFSCHRKEAMFLFYFIVIIFCLVKFVWQPVPEGGWSIAEWPCSWTFLFCFVWVLAKYRDAQSANGRGAKRTGQISLLETCLGLRGLMYSGFGAIASFQGHWGVWNINQSHFLLFECESVKRFLV